MRYAAPTPIPPPAPGSARRPGRRHPGRFKPDPQRFGDLRMRLETAPGGFRRAAVPALAALALAAALGAGAMSRLVAAHPAPTETFDFEMAEAPMESGARPAPLAGAPMPPPLRTARPPSPPVPRAAEPERADPAAEAGPAVPAGDATVPATGAVAPGPDAGPARAHTGTVDAPSGPVFIDQAPRILSGSPPIYPEGALDRGLEAVVIALIAIDAEGSVTELAIETSGGAEFDAAVLASARATRFQPPVRQGRKVPARFRRPYEFALEN